MVAGTVSGRKDIPDNIRKRLEALFAMTESGTQKDAPEHSRREAEVAATKATQILQQWNLEREDILTGGDAAQNEIVEHFVDWLNSVRAEWETDLVTAIAQANFCRVIIHPNDGKAAYNSRGQWRQQKNTGGRYGIIGYEADVNVAAYIFTQLQRRLKALAYKAGAQRTEARRAVGQNTKDVRGTQNHVVYHNSWLLGSAQGVREQLDQVENDFRHAGQRNISSQTVAGQLAGETKGSAIVRVKSIEVNTWSAKKYPRLVQMKAAKVKHNSQGYSDGLTVGKGIDIRPGLKG